MKTIKAVIGILYNRKTKNTNYKAQKKTVDEWFLKVL